MDIAEGNIGSKVSYEIDIVDGKLIVKSEAALYGFLEKAGDYLKGLRVGGFEDSVVDGFLALAKLALSPKEEEEAPKPE